MLEWVHCCCSIGEEEETVTRRVSRPITREISRANIDIEMANRSEIVEYEIPTKNDSPIRRRAFI
jgi:hypothetical protein